MPLQPQQLSPPGEPIPHPDSTPPQQRPDRHIQGKLRPLLNEADRHAVADILAKAGLTQDAYRVSICAEAYTVALCRQCHRTKTLPYHCHHPLCPNCAAWQSARRALALKAWTRKAWRPKHVVLTTPHTTQSLRTQIDRIKRAWNKLRRTKWARHWAGGAWRVEITRTSNTWHVHMHVIIDAGWIDQATLARKWGRLVGTDKAIVWVKDLKARDALHEATKYAVKPAQVATLEPAVIPELMHALRKNRLYGTWGSAHAAVSTKPEPTDADREKGLVCACGASDWEFFTDTEWEAWTAIHGEPTPLPLPLDNQDRAPPTEPAPALQPSTP